MKIETSLEFEQINIDFDLFNLQGTLQQIATPFPDQIKPIPPLRYIGSQGFG